MSAMFQMAVELGPAKIRVNTVIPTWMWGPPVQNYVKWQAKEQGKSEAEIVAHIAKRFPMREIPPDDDVAEVAVLFASDRMRMVTGQYLRVDAGEKLG
jgi:NAD(P)-dependent dehydrogenase (short-subunit alcohol dehydrogenase family)